MHRKTEQKMEVNKKELYDFISTLDEGCRNADLSDVPKTGEKIRLTDTEFFYAMLNFYEPSVARIILFKGGKKHRADRL